MSWSEGYVSDIPYTSTYIRETAPSHIAFAALCSRQDVLAFAKPQKVLELGIGMGLSFLLNAASNPQTLFEGCDFNPEQIDHAQKLAAESKLNNALVLEASFQELAAAASEGQLDLDLIVLHGILSWVSDEARAAIIEIARKRLRPGGLLFVSYNCMPGWAAFAPVQRIMREHALRSRGSSLDRSASAIEMAKGLVAAGAGFTNANPSVATRLEDLKKHNPAYLAHEYLNENWTTFHFADVAKMMSGAKLGYIGSATNAENLEEYSVPAGMLPMIKEVTDAVWRETLRDVACNKGFRRDIYRRGNSVLNRFEFRDALNEVRFTLVRPRALIDPEIAGPLGKIPLNRELADALIDALDQSTPTLSELAGLPTLARINPSALLDMIVLLIHSNQAAPVFRSALGEFGAAQRFNRMIASKTRVGRFYNFVAAPLTGSAIQAANSDLICLAGVAECGEDAEKLTPFFIRSMNEIGLKLPSGIAGVALSDEQDIRASVSKTVSTFLTSTLKLWKHLGVC